MEKIDTRQIVEALGGSENVLEIEPCITRVRIVVKDPSLVDDVGIRTPGVFGAVRSANVVQIVVGIHADDLAAQITGVLENERI
ncbi:MAG: PTS transporter subunit EIIB [Actinomycetaceae bacterium]|nr:PTS transporter subunit EIIB [Actinomycetaceae bacterium]